MYWDYTTKGVDWLDALIEMLNQLIGGGSQ